MYTCIHCAFNACKSSLIRVKFGSVSISISNNKGHAVGQSESNLLKETCKHLFNALVREWTFIHWVCV